MYLQWSLFSTCCSSRTSLWFANNLPPEAWSTSVLSPLTPHMLHVTDQIFLLSVLCTHCSECLWLYLFLLFLLINMQILRDIFIQLWQYNKFVVLIFSSIWSIYIIISCKACLVVKNFVTCMFKVFLVWSFIFFFLRHVVTDPRVVSLSVCNWRWHWTPSKCWHDRHAPPYPAQHAPIYTSRWNLKSKLLLIGSFDLLSKLNILAHFFMVIKMLAEKLTGSLRRVCIYYFPLHNRSKFSLFDWRRLTI